MSEIDIKRVQKKLIEMAVIIANVLEEHNIPYMIAYGSLLGAVRHRGFIPWDDDFDFYLFDDSYDEAIEILRNELPKDMFVEDEKTEPLFYHAWARVKDLNSFTVCQEYPQDSLYSHRGISVDLFRTKCQPLCELESFLCQENEKYINRRKSKGLISQEEYDSRMEKLLLQKKQLIEIKVDSCERVYNLLPLYECHYAFEKDIFPLKRYDFEGYTFWGPNNGEKILTDIYHNYMEIPTIGERKNHYSTVEFLES